MQQRIMLLDLCVYSLRSIRANLLSHVSMSANDTGVASISSRTVYLEVLDLDLISRTTSATIEASTVHQHSCKHRLCTISVHFRFKEQLHLAECGELVHLWKTSLTDSCEI